ncbi:DUF4254 domain-containing protein [Nocardia macrotermitis]|uniref:DUF4254 domain-containing protein n=1 Tax=Nocardia macrotermitis TaxID=2585198 RepID=A0A7K0D3K5_9NOCA|nr:DUF4254 domain-containing protein [Nocardia macrotermitis]MQY20247.1 hypothetical protein [Nocardia macrotermitis]
MATEYAGGRNGFDELPTAPELLRAFHTPADRQVRPHAVLRAAHALVGCHERRQHAVATAHTRGIDSDRLAQCSRTVGTIDAERAKLVAAIDIWVADTIPHRTGATLHTETLGAVIDRLAAKWVVAQDALGLFRSDSESGRPRDEHRGVDLEAHLHWVRLAELTDGYQDLITDVAERRRRLPVF